MGKKQETDSHVNDRTLPAPSGIRGIGTAVLLCIASAAVAATIVAFLLYRPVPASLKTPVDPKTIDLINEDLTDARAVDLSARLGEESSVSAAVTGTLTGTLCTAGASITSGTSTFTIDKSPLINLHTDIPLWRDLSFGMTGGDISALQRELARIGAQVTETGRFDWQTWAAWDELVEATGGDTEYGTLKLADTVWIPATETRVSACPVSLGQTVSKDKPLIALPTPLLQAAVKSYPSDLIPGARTLLVGDTPVEMTERGEVTEKGLIALAETDQFLQYLRNPKDATLSAELVLANPVTVYPVPPAAVAMTGDTSGCVLFPDGSTTPVNVVASKLGRSYITFAKKPTATQVQTHANKELRCS